jgi:hypothetical protein
MLTYCHPQEWAGGLAQKCAQCSFTTEKQRVLLGSKDIERAAVLLSCSRYTHEIDVDLVFCA